MPNYGFKTHMKRCKRCNEIYRTAGKFSKICPECSKMPGGKRNISEVYVRCGTLTELALERIKTKVVKNGIK
jgi:hypothetical protein